MPARICIVTEEFAGVNKSGGIGAACRGLSEVLAGNGYNVDVVITDLDCSAKDASLSSAALKNNIIFLRDFIESRTEIANANSASGKSYAVFLYLKDAHYDVIHFNEWMGSGFYSSMARRQGLFSSIIVTNIHGSSEWVRRHNKYAPTIEDLEREAIERSQIENSDYVISPSLYLLDWCRQQGIKLPEHKRIQWFLPQWMDQGPLERREPLTCLQRTEEARELIFFGRHELRKGFELFVGAVSRFPKAMQPDLTFIGRFDRIHGEFSGSYALRKLSDYRGRIRFIDNLNQQEAMDRIAATEGALCVMPSLIENSPCVVGECLTLGVPFVATAVGGTAELIAESSRQTCLTKPDAGSLSEKLLEALRGGQEKIVSTVVPEDVKQHWLTWHEKILQSEVTPAPLTQSLPLVTICITHFERPKLLRRALNKIMEQTYDNIEVVLVDDGSTGADALAYLDEIEASPWRYPLRIIRSENQYLGAARNLAVRHAKGEYVLFHDDDNFAEPDEIATFVSAALSSGCDVLTSVYWIVRDGQHESLKKVEYYPVGTGGSFSFFKNSFGDANALVRKSLFLKLGGFTELRGVGWEDWEFFLRAYLHGARMGVVPLPLFNYRASQTGMLATGNIAANYERIFDLLDELKPGLNSDIFRVFNGNWLHDQSKAKLRDDLAGTVGKEFHMELMHLSPGSSEARAMLSDFAFALGRIPDAIEIGLASFERRNNLAVLASALEREPVVRYDKKIYFRPSEAAYPEVYGLRGWAFSDKQQSFLPASLSINGKSCKVIGINREDRIDVNRSFGIGEGVNLGFFIFAERKQASGIFKKHVSARGPKPWNVRFHVPVFKKVRLHLDQVHALQKIELPEEIAASWKRLTIEANADSVMVLLFEQTGEIIGSTKLGRKVIFVNSGKYHGKMSLLASQNMLIDVLSESSEDQAHIATDAQVARHKPRRHL